MAAVGAVGRKFDTIVRISPNMHSEEITRLSISNSHALRGKAESFIQPEGQAQCQSPALRHTARAGARTTLAGNQKGPQRATNEAGQSPRWQHSLSPYQVAQHGSGNVCDARTKLGAEGGHGLGLRSSWQAACCNNKNTEEAR